MNELFDKQTDVDGDGSFQLRRRKSLDGELNPAQREPAGLGDGGTPGTQSRDEDCDAESTIQIAAWNSNPMSTSASGGPSDA